jgi:hypothetical protein
LRSLLSRRPKLENVQVPGHSGRPPSQAVQAGAAGFCDISYIAFTKTTYT